MTADEIKSRITPHLSAFKAVRDAVDVAEKMVNTADRERIAELERDLAHARATVAAGVVKLTERDIICLAFIYDRMLHVHEENEHVDYMLALRRAVDAAKSGLVTP